MSASSGKLICLINKPIEGTLVHVLEDDDGSGWVKVADDRGGKGLVPASYIETTNAGDDARPAAQSQSLKPQKTYGASASSFTYDQN